MNTCKIEYCNGKVNARGYCKSHYNKFSNLRRKATDRRVYKVEREKKLRHLKDEAIKKLASDKTVKSFISVTLAHKPLVDHEKIREILAVSKIYDNNYLRLREAIQDDRREAVLSYRRIEKKLNLLGMELRVLCGIRQGEIK